MAWIRSGSLSKSPQTFVVLVGVGLTILSTGSTYPGSSDGVPVSGVLFFAAGAAFSSSPRFLRLGSCGTNHRLGASLVAFFFGLTITFLLYWNWGNFTEDNAPVGTGSRKEAPYPFHAGVAALLYDLPRPKVLWGLGAAVLLATVVEVGGGISAQNNILPHPLGRACLRPGAAFWLFSSRYFILGGVLVLGSTEDKNPRDGRGPHCGSSRCDNFVEEYSELGATPLPGV